MNVIVVKVKFNIQGPNSGGYSYLSERDWVPKMPILAPVVVPVRDGELRIAYCIGLSDVKMLAPGIDYKWIAGFVPQDWQERAKQPTKSREAFNAKVNV